MNKAKLFLLSAVIALIIAFICVGYRMANETTTCAVYVKYDQWTIRKDASFQIVTDSVCTVEGNGNGDLFVKKFKSKQ